MRVSRSCGGKARGAQSTSGGGGDSPGRDPVTPLGEPTGHCGTLSEHRPAAGDGEGGVSGNPAEPSSSVPANVALWRARAPLGSISPTGLKEPDQAPRLAAAHTDMFPSPSAERRTQRSTAPRIVFKTGDSRSPNQDPSEWGDEFPESRASSSDRLGRRGPEWADVSLTGA